MNEIERYILESRVDQPLLTDLSKLITVAAMEGIPEPFIIESLDNRLLFKKRNNTDLEELDFILKGLDNIRNSYHNVIIKRKKQLIENEGKAINFNQPKFKVTNAAELLKLERATVNNWTNKIGGYIRSFEIQGKSKFILLEDIKGKYKELYSQELEVPDDFIKSYSYDVKIKEY